jgi:hypothetical protein
MACSLAPVAKLAPIRDVGACPTGPGSWVSSIVLFGNSLRQDQHSIELHLARAPLASIGHLSNLLFHLLCHFFTHISRPHSSDLFSLRGPFRLNRDIGHARSDCAAIGTPRPFTADFRDGDVFSPFFTCTTLTSWRLVSLRQSPTDIWSIETHR